jgi:hypothetical protein
MPMWKTAMSFIFELHDYEDNGIANLGFGLHHTLNSVTWIFDKPF